MFLLIFLGKVAPINLKFPHTDTRFFKKNLDNSMFVFHQLREVIRTKFNFGSYKNFVFI